jgi:hypothetical protein
MNFDRRFPLQVLIALVVASVLSAYPLARFGSSDAIAGFVIGAAISTLNVMLGFVAIEYSFDKSYTIFLRWVLGGMGLRMLLMLGLLAGMILVFRVDTVSLTVSVLGFYLVFLILEVLFIQRKMLAKHSG